MVQEQQPPQGRKTDARKESNGAGKDAKNDPVDNQALELGAAQSADLQVAATAPAAMGSLTGYIQDDFAQSQHDTVVNDDTEHEVGAVTAREFSAPKAETAHDATTETRLPEVTASTAHPLGEEVLDTSSAPDASPPTQGSSSLASSVPELPPQQAEIAFEAPSGAIAEKTDARLEQASEETEDKTWPTEPVQVFELQLAEGNAGGSTVLALPVEGEFGDRITYSFTDATGNPVDHDDFHLFGNLLQVAPGGAPDFEAGDSQVLYVTATTPAGTSPPWPIRLTITDVAEDLVLDDGGAAFTDHGVSEHSITGGAGADRIVGHEASGMVDGASGDDTLIGGAGSDSLTGGAGNDLLVGGYADDAAFFTGRWADYRITDEDGVISVVDLRPGSPDGTDMLVDVETLHFADGWVTAADAPNDAPVLQAYGGSISENDPGAVVADVASRDADAGDTVALSVDDARFEVADGTLKLREGVSLDYEADGPQIAVTMTATDSHGETDAQTVIVTVADTGEALVLDSGGVELADVGAAEVSITGNEGADRIVGHDAGGVLDGAGGDDTLSGGAAADTLTGGLGDDVLIGGGGADVAVFSGSWADYTIAESDGVFKVTDNRVDSPDGSDTLSGIEVLRFSDGVRSIADALNDAPVLEVADGSVAENVAGSIVGRVSSTDADAGDKSRFTVDDPRFEVQGGGLLKLRDGVSLDYESDGPALTVTVTATDSHGATGSQTVTVTVTDTGEALVLDNGGAVFTDLGVAETTIVGGDGGDRISGHATDGGVLDGALGDDTLSGGSGDETIMGGEGSDHAIWSGNLAEFAVSYDSAGDAFTIRDQDASDGDEGTDTVTGVESFEFGGLTYDAAEMQTEAARQANSGPGSASVASGGAVDENSAPGTVVATLTASDADGDALTFSLSDADGNPVTDGNFVIVGSEIRVREGANLDFESSASHHLFVTASDAFETSAPQAITVTVNDLAEEILLADGGASFADTGVSESKIDGGEGADFIIGSSGDDFILGHGGADTLEGGAGNDFLDDAWGADEGTGDDVFRGGSGNDTLWGGNDNDALYGDDDNDELHGQAGDDQLSGGAGDDRLYGESGSDTIDGGSGSDFLAGNDGDDLLSGGDGADFLDGDAGDDTLLGGGGNDTFEAHAGNDYVDGGTGHDTIRWDNALSDFLISYDGASATFQITDTSRGSTVDTVTNVETFVFAGVNYSSDDMQDEAARQANSTPTDVFFASGGSVNETVSHGGTKGSAFDPSGTAVARLGTTDADSGSHSYALLEDPSGKFEIVGDEVRVKPGQTIDYETDKSFDLTIQTTDAYGSTLDKVLTLNVIDFEGAFKANSEGEAVTGTSEEDVIKGQLGADTIDGGAGADSIYGGDGNDTLVISTGADRLDGGAGADKFEVSDAIGAFGDDTIIGGEGGDDTDTLDLSAMTGPVAVTLEAAETGTVTDEVATISFTEIEQVVLTSLSDSVDTTNAATGMRFDLADGNDTFTGGVGDDTVRGGAGDDVINGGFNWITFANGSDLQGTDGLDYFRWAPETNDTATIRFNNSPRDGESDGRADYIAVENLNSSWLTIGDFDLTVDQIVLQENWTDFRITNHGGESDVVLTFANGIQQGFTLFFEGGSATLDQIFTLAMPDISDTDVAVYQGEYTDFDISYNAATGAFTITDGNVKDGLDEGTDTLINVETFRFNDVDFDAASFRVESTIEAGSFDYDAGQSPDYGELTADGGGGEATINTGSSDQVIYGRAASNTINSSTGDDVIFAGSGDDLVSSGGGADTLFGGTGDDWMSGGDGNDIFVATALEGRDTIDGGEGWIDAIELAGFSGTVDVTGSTIDGQGWTVLLESGHEVTGQTLDSIELSADAVGTITFDEGGTIDFSGIERIAF